MKNDEELKQIAKTILQLKGKNSDFCPFCGNISQYYPNPMYMHICKTCSKQMGMNDLIHKSDLDYMVEFLKKEFYEIISLDE